MKKLSLVVPMMNEEENVVPLIKKVREALANIDYELILIDDGSSDKTVERIKENLDEKTKLVVFTRNYGQTIAMSAGIDIACGELIATLDGDLQNDPTDIPMMIEKLESEGWDLIAGKRVKREDDFLFRKLPSKIANKLIRKLTGVYVSDYGCTLKLFKSSVAKNLELYGELHRFIPVLAHLNGATITEVNVKHHSRVHGKSKYGLNRTFKVASDLLLMVFMEKYRQKPMHLFGGLGIMSFGIGMIINFYMFCIKLLGYSIGTRPLLILGVMMTFIGIILVVTGFLAELIVRTYYAAENKKPYTVEKIIERK